MSRLSLGFSFPRFHGDTLGFLRVEDGTNPQKAVSATDRVAARIPAALSNVIKWSDKKRGIFFPPSVALFTLSRQAGALRSSVQSVRIRYFDRMRCFSTVVYRGCWVGFDHRVVPGPGLLLSCEMKHGSLPSARRVGPPSDGFLLDSRWGDFPPRRLRLGVQTQKNKWWILTNAVYACSGERTHSSDCNLKPAGR